MARCLDVNSLDLSTDVYPFVLDNGRENRSAGTSPNPIPLPKRLLNPRAFYFYTRTEQVSFYLSFNFHVQYTNKNAGSLWWSLKTTRHSCVAGASKEGAIKNGRARRYACLSKQYIVTESKQNQYGRKYNGRFHRKKDTPPNLLEMLLWCSSFKLKELIKVKKVKPCRFFFLSISFFFFR